MHGTGPVLFAGAAIYAYFTLDGAMARLRMSADECDRLDLFAGKQVRVGLPRREPTGALVTAVRAEPPFAWVEMELNAEPALNRPAAAAR